jgi:outer membrane protein assembly factor BamA
LDVIHLNARTLIIPLSIILIAALFSDSFPHDPSSGGRLRGRVDDAIDYEAWCEEIGCMLEPYYGTIVDTIIVSGNTRTKRVTIIREMATKQGRPLVEDLIRRDTSYLRGLGYFSELDIHADRTARGGCRITVTIAERPDLFMKYPYPVVNYDFTAGVSYGFRWRIKNFRGYGEHLSISVLKRRDRDHGGGISWNVPWVGGRRLRFDAHLYTFRRLEEPESEDFVKERNGGRIAVGIPITESLVRQVWISPVVSFERRESRISLGNDVGSAADYYRQNFLATGLVLSYDSRDNIIAPFRGVFSRCSAVRYTAVHGLEQNYIVYRGKSCIYLPLGPLGSLIHAVDVDVREGDVPSSLEMELGGSGSLRGYSRSGKGTAKLVQSLQLRRRVTGPHVFNIPHIGKFDVTVNVTAFVDNGALSRSISDFDESRFHTTGGFGIEIISPVQDIIRFETAFDGEGNALFSMVSGTRF